MDERDNDDGTSITYGKPLPAMFQVDEGREVSGYVLLNRGDYFASRAVLVSSTPFRVPEGSDVTGICKAKKISLLNCHGCRSSGGVFPTANPDQSVSECEVSFMYATFGEHHLSRDDRNIQGIRFTFDHADTMLTNLGYDAFGELWSPNREVLDAIKQQIETDEFCHHLPNDFRYDGTARVRYFTGKHTLFPDTDTVLGTISASRRIWFWSGSKARRKEDYPFLTIDFHDHPVTLEEAFDKMRIVRQFFTWMTGFAPRWSDVHVAIRAEDPVGTFVHSPVEWDETQDQKNPARHRNMLIDPSRDPDKFSEVLAGWLERNARHKRGVANELFFASMPGMFSRTVEQKIRQAADAFDILPQSDKPELPPIPEPIRNLLSRVHADIRRLREYKSDPVRERVLSSLGRLHSYVTLRDTVEHRVDIILDHLDDDRMPRLKELAHMAVSCRNYLTHNSRPPDGVDFTSNNTVALLAETLQFIYGASELVKCDWDMNAWLDGSFAQFHAFGIYVKRGYGVAVHEILYAREQTQ